MAGQGYALWRIYRYKNIKFVLIGIIAILIIFILSVHTSILKLLPNFNAIKNVNVDDKEFVRIEAIICSMTKKERENPSILNGQRRLRIAKGSGTTVEQINKFMKSFELTQKMMKEMTSGKGMKNMMRNLNKAGVNTKAFEGLDLDSLNIDDLK